ncbi:hypothetical protein PE067_14320 [Paracoccus sp. DMF-8]|uniref:hypothetical protein n=1 Tax=Paracoccus sp. DMF-8 TaxID=3019445 RepID=UPI0023E3A3CE|nr:hypothetical protein [Paracoccus sp. DMF-8]MDF3607199.1 hypothetical protein [Paracoccus sp. DMF-8]
MIPDGTLADTSGDLIAAGNACFIDRGLGPLLDPARDALVAFQGGRAILQAGYAYSGGYDPAPEALEQDYPRLIAHYGRAIAPPIPGFTPAPRRRWTGWPTPATGWRSAPTSPLPWPRCCCASWASASVSPR